MKNTSSTSSRYSAGLFGPLVLLGLLTLLFWRSFHPDFVHFSNDGPLGLQNADWVSLPSASFGMWDDLNDTGYGAGSFAPSITMVLKWFLGPVGCAKFYAPATLFILGLGAWTFFRTLKFTPLAALLGALAALLNSVYFAGACWGVASMEIAIGMDFFALALIVANTQETPWLTRWLRLALAGCCVGMNVMEGADVGAMCSLLVALFVFFKSLVEADGSVLIKTMRGVSRVAVIAIFAGFIAVQTVFSLVGTSVQGVAGTAQDTETKAQQWDWATQWSLPKKETLGLVVPGLFGYRMDTPNKMLPALQPAYQGGVYWGGIGRSPEIDRFFDRGQEGNPPPGMMRFGYSGYYCGLLVVLVALWAVAQAARRKNSAFSEDQKKYIWFWTVVLGASLLLAWGRFAPIFYGLLYQLPYFSTIRNPQKFLNFFCWALIVLFTYGLDALNRRYLDPAPGKMITAKLDDFNRQWTFACVAFFGAGVLGWLYFSAHQADFIGYLQKVGFGDANFSRKIADFSLGQVGWFLGLLAVAVTLLTLVLRGYFSGPRARLGGWLLGAFLVFDLGRANLPFVIHWDYKQKYEIGSLNPVVERLRQKPYEQRVAGLPFEAQQRLRSYDNYFGGSGVYRIEWMQHHFPYYNIQCLDIIQMPRMPEDLKAYLEALSPRGTAESLPLLTRHWELTNTRYILGAAGYLEVINQQLDPQQKRFRIAERFDLVLKTNVVQINELEDLTAVLSGEGELALFEFTGALPRAKLYGNWVVNTNDAANLKTLADLNFDPSKTVLISTPQTGLPASATNDNSGTVAFQSYSPKRIVLSTQSGTPSVLLLNDKYEPNWRVRVDGQPAELLRCNFLMRGVQLSPGAHTVEFTFNPPTKPLYVTLAALGVAAIIGGLLLVLTRRQAEMKVQP